MNDFFIVNTSDAPLQVIVTADLTKSPPVIKVYSVNPYAESMNSTNSK